VPLRLATLFAAQSFDFATFVVMVARHGATSEANPVIGSLFVALGWPAVVAVKAAVIALVGGLTMLGSAHRHDRRIWAVVGGLPLAIAIAAGLVGGITNAATYLEWAHRVV